MTSDPRVSRPVALRGFENTPGFAALCRQNEMLKRWLCEDALPLWADRGVDTMNGGFYEQIAQNGHVIEGPRRTRLVARQIYVFATAADMGWAERAGAMNLVGHGLDFLLGKCVSGDGVTYATVHPNGELVRAGFDLYDNAFALFALATSARVNFRRATVADAGRNIVNAMVDGWKHPVAGFEESSPPGKQLNANPHMHLLEAFLEWEDAGEAGAWRILSDEIAELALSTFIDSDSGGLREHYDRKWRPAPGDDGRLLEPGHHFEWAWLLWRWGVSRGHEDATVKARRLTEIGEDHGVSCKTGLTMNELWDDLSVRNGDSRLWPQTERVKAHLAMAELADDESACSRAIGRAASAADGLRRYLDTDVAGLWHETLDPHGTPVAASARGSSLYHIVSAVKELDRFVARRG